MPPTESGGPALFPNQEERSRLREAFRRRDLFASSAAIRQAERKQRPGAGDAGDGVYSSSSCRRSRARI